MRGETEKSKETQEGTPARIPYIGKPVKKRKCWRPKRKEHGGEKGMERFLKENAKKLLETIRYEIREVRTGPTTG